MAEGSFFPAVLQLVDCRVPHIAVWVGTRTILQPRQGVEVVLPAGTKMLQRVMRRS